MRRIVHFAPLFLAAIAAACGSSSKTTPAAKPATVAAEVRIAATAPPSATQSPSPSPQASAPSPTTTSATTGAAAAGAAPIQFTFLGLSDDKVHTHYTIKVITQKPISQVDLDVKESGAAGKVLFQSTVIWQNIVKSVQQPIQSGQTYDVEDFLYPGSVKAEARLLRVVYTDHTTWDAPK